MFRGVLYRQLRSASHNIGMVLSIVISILITSFLFAAIHPQGWVAIPALMGIAIGMNLMREWRGSLIPSMMVHGISNGIVVSMLTQCWSVGCRIFCSISKVLANLVKGIAHRVIDFPIF